MWKKVELTGLTPVASLEGAALDWAVAKCEGLDVSVIGNSVLLWVGKDSNIDYEPSTDWLEGGPIIEREGISVVRVSDSVWDAHMSNVNFFESGTTPLIAAIRCYVASKLGDEVELPAELREK